MPSLLITVFVIQLVIYLINTIGASTINDLVFSFSHLLLADSDLITMGEITAMATLHPPPPALLPRPASTDPPTQRSGAPQA
jgi:hypothetical protein